MALKVGLALAATLVMLCVTACADGGTDSRDAADMQPPSMDRVASPDVASPAAATETDARSAERGGVRNTEPAASTTPSAGVFRSARFPIRFTYPADWEPIEGYEARYGGPDGFIQADALDGAGWTLDEAAIHLASHQLRPYGSDPTVVLLLIGGQSARLILPSDDQPAAMRGEALVVIGAPHVVEIDGARYNFLLLYGDLDHLRGIAATVTFP